MRQFPDGFVWGVATSAYQIEGGWNEDGRSQSIWDHFAHTPGHTPGHTHNNSNGNGNGNVACDHYHRWPEDIQLMADLGLQAYRFSISWPRILPDGTGRVNQAGLDFYSRLVDGLLAAGITPYLTLYHWELPQVLQEAGGWPERETAVAFAELADVVSQSLGDRVKQWITHNEPWCASFLGHQVGVHAPGWQNWPAALTTAHHLLLSHGLAAERIRANVPDSQVGIAVNFEPGYPASDDPADKAMARIWDGYYFRWFVDPLFGRLYPADMVAHYEQIGALPHGLDFVQAGDMATIASPLDFFGVNYYTRHLVRAGMGLDDHRMVHNPGAEYTQMGWEVCPEAFYHLLNRLYFEYQMPPIYITENGCSYLDGPDENGRVADQKRIDYLNKHLTAVHRAIANGVPIKGYMQWSFMDNFEWAEGYTQRFGIVYVDYETQKRYPKESAYWYRDLIQQNGLE